MGVQTWEDVDVILYDGTPEEIAQLRCPDCGGILSYFYTRFDDDDTASASLLCETCQTLVRDHFGPNQPVPNCVEFYGTEFQIDGNLKLKATA